MNETEPTFPTLEPKHWVLLVIAGITFLSGLWGAGGSMGFATAAGIGFWLSSGYIGAFWLMKKGYFLELAGCAILAGGLPILLPLVLGPTFLFAAYFLPDRLFASRTKVSQPTRQIYQHIEERLNRIQEQLCDICGDTKCTLLKKFTFLVPSLAKENWGYDTCYSVWLCPNCNRYYLREWEINWENGQPKVARFQYALANEIKEAVAIELLDMLTKCPNPMSQEPELCNCPLHRQGYTYFTYNSLKDSRGAGRFSSEDSLTTMRMSDMGTDFFKKNAGRPSKVPISTFISGKHNPKRMDL